MICISVTPESRRLAKVDLLNASRHCDLIEFCLDRLVKLPDMGELLKDVKKPVLVSCRREQDGGQWRGSEEERLGLLRQAILAGPEYIELELDIASSIPRFGNTKRVVSFTSIDKPLAKIDTIFERAYKAKADIVKVTWPTATLNAAWPLLAAVTEKRELPVVGQGLGQSSLTFSLLGLKYGSPWIYAALEKGMEAHAGQATFVELEEVYGWRQIDPKTQFVGILGLGAGEAMAARLFNRAFDVLGMNARSLPLAFGKLDKIPQMLDILKINALVVNPHLGEHILPLAQKSDEFVQQTNSTDLLKRGPNGWAASNTLWKAAVSAIEKKLGAKSADDYPLERKTVMVIGNTALSQAMAQAVQSRKGLLSINGADEDAAKSIAAKLEARYVSTATLYDTLCDVVILTDRSMRLGPGKRQLNPSYLRPQMTIADVTNVPDDTPALIEARERGCKVVEPSDIFADQIQVQFKSITGKQLPEDVLQEAMRR